MRLYYIQHVPFEGPGSIEHWAKSRKVTLIPLRVYEEDPFPDLSPADDRPSVIDGLILMGGPMGVDDIKQYPWLTEEKEFIRNVIGMKKPILGVCLGAQLLAQAFGARVFPHRQKEIGWYPIRFTDESLTTHIFKGVSPEHCVLHWHGDTFSLPDSSVHIASNKTCENQAFLVDDQYLGLQFHLETDKAGLAQLVENCASELRPPPQNALATESLAGADYATVSTAEDLLVNLANLEANSKLMSQILDRLFLNRPANETKKI